MRFMQVYHKLLPYSVEFLKPLESKLVGDYDEQAFASERTKHLFDVVLMLGQQEFSHKTWHKKLLIILVFIRLYGVS